MDISNLLNDIAHCAAQLTQSQYFTFIYCFGTFIFFIALLLYIAREKNYIVQSCKEATRAVKSEIQNDDDIAAAVAGPQNENRLPNEEKRRNEITFKYNFSKINDELCKNAIFKHHWSEFTESLVHSNDNDTPVQNSHPAAFFFNEDTIIIPNYSAATYTATPNYLTGFGILGTFLGLAGGIYLASAGLSGGFDADNTEKLRTALNQLLSGAGLAFMTSIVGLACSLAFAFREKYIIRELQKSLATLLTLLMSVCT